jgi:hypothetical protein
MSINLGIYDLFAYIIPGLLYIYAINDVLRNIGWKFVDIGLWLKSGQSISILVIIPVLLGAYLIGQILDLLANRMFSDSFYWLIHRKRILENSLQRLKDRYPGISIQFEPKDWSMLFAFIRQRNPEMGRIIDNFVANSIMLRNVAFGAFLFAVSQIVAYITTGFQYTLFNVIISIVVCVLAAERGNQYRVFFFTDIFRASLEYGSSLKEVIGYKDKEKGPPTKLKRR